MVGPVVSGAWWREHRAEVVLVDARWYLDGRSGREAYDTGHLPGAVHVDLERWLAAPASPAAGRHPLPDPAAFAGAMSALGIGDDDTVVAYDDAGGSVAARLVWMLRATGHQAALLDGGLRAAPLERTPSTRPPTTFTTRPWPADRLASLEDALGEDAVVLDARDGERYRGEHEPVDPRAGHVPGARSLPWRDLVVDGTLLPADALRARFAAEGVGEGTPVVAYCGSGVTACLDLLALEQAGLGTGRLFPGSWSQYSADPDRPAATGEPPAR